MLRPTPKEITQLAIFSPKPSATEKAAVTVTIKKCPRPQTLNKFQGPKLWNRFQRPQSLKAFQRPQSLKRFQRPRCLFAKDPLVRERITNKPLLSSILDETDKLSYKKKMRKLISRKMKPHSSLALSATIKMPADATSFSTLKPNTWKWNDISAFLWNQGNQL